MNRIIIWVLIYIICFNTVFAQGENADLSITYATHVQLAFGLSANNLYKGNYGRARSNYTNQLSQFKPKGDGVLDFKDISRMKDNRPRYFKILETIDRSDFRDIDYITYSRNLNAMGIYYHALGQLRLADVLFTRCIKIQGEKFGKTSGLYIATLQNLANLRKDQGRFDASEDIFKYVLRYYKQVNGKQSREYIITLGNKAMLDVSLGRTKSAFEQLDEAAELLKHYKFSEQSIDAERIIINKALLAIELDKTELALGLLTDAMISLEQKEYDNHPDYNDLIIFLGSIYLNNDSSSQFTPLVEKAIRKAGSTYGKDHPFYANVLALQAEKYLKSGNYSEAKEAWQTIVNIRKNKLGDRHPLYLNALAKLAYTESLIGNSLEALDYFQETIDTYFHLSTLFFPNMSEVEQAKFWATFKANINLFYQFAMANANMQGVPEAVMNVQLNTKGMLLNNSRKVKEGILSSKNASLITKFQQWQSIKEELAGYYTLSKEALAGEEIDLALQEAKSNELEKELVRESAAFSGGLAFDIAAWQDIRSQLNEKEMAVEIVRVEGSYNEYADQPHYFALVLGPDTGPQIIMLSPGAELEGKYYKYYKNTIRTKIKDNLSYGNYWGPLELALASAERIFISPDGIYNSISLLTLNKDNKFLLDEKEILVVNNLKSLLRFKNGLSEQNANESMLIGNPEYGDPIAIKQLPGTENEVIEIEDILNEHNISAERIIGAEATELLLKSVSNPGILHIATHGFFLNDIDNSSSTQMRGINLSSAQKHPLLRSGLLLAGAAKQDGVEVGLERKDNGILTAFEAMNLNLEGTRLVVLSACETGLGEVVSGEGVYGLSRSFKAAGSKAVIISLWKVDDEATQLLMTKFYELWLASNQLETSFLAAQQFVRQEYPEPYYWGSFILLK